MPVYLCSTCPLCGALMVMRNARKTGDRFLGCSKYPDCRGTTAYDEALGELVEQLAKRPPRNKPEDIRRLIYRFHPDRAGATVPTHEVLVALTALLEQAR